MIAVFKNEFSSLFHRLYAYIVVSLSVLASAFFFINYNLTYASENIASVISAMSIVTALLIPIIAVNIYPNRKKYDTDAMYDILPLISFDIVIGKYLAALAVLMLPDIFMVLFPIIAGMFGNIDLSMSYSAFVGYLLFECAYLAVCMFFASFAKSKVRAYLWSYITTVIWYLLSFLSVLIPKKSIFVYFEDIMDSVSVFEQLNKFMQGIFNLRGVIFYILITVAFLFLAWRNHAKKYIDAKKVSALNFKNATSLLLAIVITVTAFVVPLGATVIPDSAIIFDSTQSNKNSVSEAAKEYLKAVDKNVTIYLLESTGNSDYEMYLQKLAACNKKIDLKKIYNSNTPEFYEDRGINFNSISANSLVIESGDNIYYIAYTSMFYYSNTTLGASKMSYSEYSYYYSMFSSNQQYAQYLEALVYDTVMYFDADKFICSYIEYATAEIIPTNYFLVGHGEENIENSISPYYGMGIKSLNISENGIPNDAASILINKPENDITEGEAQMLTEYLAKGGQITFITVENNLSMPNLCSVLKVYGMSASTETVKESVTTESGEENSKSTAEYVPVVHTDNDILYYLDGSGSFAPTVKNANAIFIDTDIKERLSLTVTELISSSDKAFFYDDTENTATYTLACAVEAPSGARLVWFTGEGYNDNKNTAALAVMYAMNWVTLVFESHTENIPAVLYSTPVTSIDSAGAKIFSFVLIVIPILICTFGIISYYKRKKA